ncbi:hypothetical protein V6N13_068548 [Hibiscus sabdariffa]
MHPSLSNGKVWPIQQVIKETLFCLTLVVVWPNIKEWVYKGRWSLDPQVRSPKTVLAHDKKCELPPSQHHSRSAKISSNEISPHMWAKTPLKPVKKSYLQDMLDRHPPLLLTNWCTQFHPVILLMRVFGKL